MAGFVLSYEFGATVLGSTFETLPCYRRTTAEPNLFEFRRAVARRLEAGLKCKGYLRLFARGKRRNNGRSTYVMKIG